MKDWLTIKEFSEITKLTPKALRLYDSIDLLKAQSRGENNYRYFSKAQIPKASEIARLKNIGFSLEEIKTLFANHPNFDLQYLLRSKLEEQKRFQTSTIQRIRALEDLLSSLDSAEPLKKEQKEYIMQDLISTSTLGLERRGLFISEDIRAQIENEVDILPAQLKNVITQLSLSVENRNYLLGPGRGSAVSSFLLYSLGMTDLDPKKFDLMPEVFSNATYLWVDVEYSNYSEFGELCDRLSSELNFEVVGFKKPILDIYRAMDNKYSPIKFGAFSDDDPRIFETPRKLGVRGIWDLDWSDQFHAFQQIPKENRYKYEVNTDLLNEIIQKRGIKSSQDFMNISLLSYFQSDETLKEYIDRDSLNDSLTPELKHTNGLLLYREDWIRIFNRLANVTSTQAIQTLKALNKNLINEHSQIFYSLPDTPIKALLLQESKKVFLKSHMVSCWYHFKRTSLLKYFWGDKYLNEIDTWEQKHGIVYQDFGYKPTPDTFYLKA